MNRLPYTPILILLLTAAIPATLRAQTAPGSSAGKKDQPGLRMPFILEGHRVAPGKKISFDIQVIAPTKDSTYIPVSIIHGKSPGPVLGLIAGIHGFEYPPIMAMQQMARELNPDSLKGTVIIIHIANVKAFFGRSVYYNPVDGKNLNRQFPGDKNGSLTECIAWVLSQQILPRCNYLVDIHAGDASEDLHDYVGYYAWGQQAATAKQMAEALGFDWIMRSETGFVKGEPTVYCSKEAVKQGIPTVAIECGKLGGVTPAEIKKINDGLFNLMRSLQLLTGAPKASNKPLEITKRTTLTSEYTGIFYSDYRSGQLVKAGMKLGHITDVRGNWLTDIYSPVDGFIVYQIATPPVNKGEILFNLGSL